MKKLLPLIAIACLPIVNAIAQTAPVVKLGKIAPAEVNKGKIFPAKTTLKDVLSNSQLVTDKPGAEVKGFMFSLAIGDNRYERFWGPIAVQGNELTEEIRNKIKEWDYPNMKIYIDNIHVKANGKDVVTAPVVLAYNLPKD